MQVLWAHAERDATAVVDGGRKFADVEHIARSVFSDCPARLLEELVHRQGC